MENPWQNLYESHLWREQTVTAFVDLFDNNAGWVKEPEEGTDEDPPLLAAQKFSPLEFALMMKLDLFTIQRLYSLHPLALTPHLLHNVCMHGCQPGVVAFLAQQLPEAVSEWYSMQQHGKTLPIILAMQWGPGADRPTEQDILELVKICPRTVDHRNSTAYLPFELALKRKYSRNLIHEIFQTIYVLGTKGLELPENLLNDLPSNRDKCRKGIDMDCVHGMSPMLSQIEYFGFQSVWKIDAMLQCLEVLLKNPNLVGLEFGMGLERSRRGDEEESYLLEDAKVKPEVVKTLVQLVPSCRIKELALDYSSDYEPSSKNPCFPVLLGDFVQKMPCLEELTVSVCQDFLLAIPGLCQLLQTSQTLKSLRINISDYDMEIKGDLFPILDALVSNSVLRNFQYTQCMDLEEDKDISTFKNQVKAQLEHLSRILKTTNTTLATVDFFLHYGYGKEDVEALPEYQAIQYHTKLNLCGRRMARNPNTKLVDFVNLLCDDSLEWKTENTVDLSNVLYGLLHESPNLWTRSTCSTSPGPDATKGRRERRKDPQRKRKRSKLAAR